jgi:DNA (cytosine-5)-methyltransferase 1
MGGSAYYNENDAGAAHWLRCVIHAGLIAPGHVDERSIIEVQPDDLAGYAQCHFFAGIGGWSHALRLAGWPDDRPVWTGSCPCQPFSSAGKQKGTADARHLWPEFLRLIAVCRPAICLGEQVASRLGREWLAGVRADLEALAYAFGAADLCAAGKAAPHIRQRLYWMADAGAERWIGREGIERGGRRAAERGEACDNARDDKQFGGLADAATGGLGIDWSTPGLARHTDERREVGGAGLPLLPRLEGHAGDGDDGDEPGRLDPAADGSTAEAGGAGRVGQPKGGGNGPEQVGGSDRQSEAERRECGAGGSGASGFWSAFDVIPCRDGKARRVEPGTFPLAHGVPGRVAQLRGLGNAIVPQVAAAFILAAVHCEH